MQKRLKLFISFSTFKCFIRQSCWWLVEFHEMIATMHGIAVKITCPFSVFVLKKGFWLPFVETECGILQKSSFTHSLIPVFSTFLWHYHLFLFSDMINSSPLGMDTLVDFALLHVCQIYKRKVANFFFFEVVKSLCCSYTLNSHRCFQNRITQDS